MEAAGECTGRATVDETDAISAVATLIEEYTQSSGCVSANDHRIFAHEARDVVARIRNQRLVSDHEPAAREDTLHFEGVNRLVHEDLVADLTGSEIDEPF